MPGKYFIVDLSRSKIEKEKLDREVHYEISGDERVHLQTPVGPGQGCGRDRPGKPPYVQHRPHGRRLFNGRKGAGRGQVAQTGILGYTNFGGHWGPALKYAGYDLLIVKGRADKPVFLGSMTMLLRSWMRAICGGRIPGGHAGHQSRVRRPPGAGPGHRPGRGKPG